MENQDNKAKRAAELRQRAEETALKNAVRSPDDIESLSLERIKKTLHELRVHQIELEMQNEELRRAQAELDAARARYFDLYDLAPVGYITITGQGLIQEANLTAATLLGAPRSTLVRVPISHFISHDDQNSYYLHRKQLVETGEPQAFELRMIKSDGTAFLAQLQVTLVEEESGARVCRCILSDISRLKRDGETLRQTAARLGLAVQAGGVGIWDYDVVNNSLVWDEQMFRLYGITADKFSGAYEAWPSWLHPDDSRRGDNEIRLNLEC